MMLEIQIILIIEGELGTVIKMALRLLLKSNTVS